METEEGSGFGRVEKEEKSDQYQKEKVPKIPGTKIHQLG